MKPIQNMTRNKRNNKPKPQSKNIPNSLKINESIVIGKNVVVDEFNDFFNTSTLKIDTKIIKTDPKFYEILKNPNENTFFINPTTTKKLEDHLKLPKENKAIGLNSFPTEILKNFRKIMSQPLADLLNLVFHTGTF